MQDAPVAAHSAGEARFERWRRRAGWVLLPICALALALAPFPGLSRAAHQLAVIDGLVVLAWLTEIVPLWVPALLGPLAAALLGVAGLDVALGPFIHPLILLFLGGFILAAGLSAQGVDRRAAMWVLAREWIDSRPERVRVAVVGTTFAFSMWISNTATTAMMVPIALGLSASLDAQLRRRQGRGTDAGADRWTEGLLISLAYAASLGGVCTPIGTAPNMLAVNHLESEMHITVDFARWMGFALPTALTVLLGVLFIAARRFAAPVARVEGLQAEVRAELETLGPVRSGERRVVAVFAVAVALWVAPAILRLIFGEAHAATVWARTWLEEGYVAVVCGLALLVLPRGAGGAGSAGEGEAPRASTRLLTPRQALSIDWGTLILLGGGFSLGKLTFDTGLAARIGEGVMALAPPGPTGLLVVATALVLYLTELTSNTATTSMMLPVLTPVAVSAGFDPIPVALSVTMAASCAFMMPVGTPPNAIVYGTRKVRFSGMFGFGARMDLWALVVLLAVGAWWLPHLGW